MAGDTTPRLALPMLQPGQAQKEWRHNEALAVLDAVIQPCVVTAGDNAPPAVPRIGEAWLVGDSPEGAWAGHAQALACWTEGGWRFAAPVEGMRVWNAAAAVDHRYSGGQWIGGAIRGSALLVGGQQVVGARQTAIAPPAGGATVDAQARATLTKILATLQVHGLISG